jgi:hypothetical protein
MKKASTSLEGLMRPIRNSTHHEAGHQHNLRSSITPQLGKMAVRKSLKRSASKISRSSSPIKAIEGGLKGSRHSMPVISLMDHKLSKKSTCFSIIKPGGMPVNMFP